ncbi:hypothetical protein PG989_015278 [Apiospora arundinis]
MAKMLKGLVDLRARIDVLKAFFPDQALTKQDLSFEALASHELMHKSIWRRLPFLFYDPDTWSRVTNGDIWVANKPSEGEQGAERAGRGQSRL